MSVLLGPAQANRFDRVHLITFKGKNPLRCSPNETVVISILDRNRYPLLLNIKCVGKYDDYSQFETEAAYIALKLGLQYCQYYSRNVVCFGQRWTYVNQMNSDLRIEDEALNTAKNDVLEIAKNFDSVTYQEVDHGHAFFQQARDYLSEIDSFGGLHGQLKCANLCRYVKKDTTPNWAVTPHNDLNYSTVWIEYADK